MHRYPQAALAMLAAVILSFPGSPALSEIHYWDAWDPAATAFHTPAHWDPTGPPGTADDARFNVADTNLVTFTSSVTNRGAGVQWLAAAAGIEMTFDLNGETWSLTGADNGDTAGLMVGRSGAATMVVTNGTLAVGSYVIGSMSGADGTLILRGSNTLMTSSSANGIISRSTGSRGTLRIEQGARAEFQNLRAGLFGSTEGQSGHVVVTGPGSFLQVNAGTVDIRSPGAGSHSSLLFSDGAGGQIDALRVDEHSTITVSGSGTRVTNVHTIVDSRVNVNGLMIVKDGGYFEHLNSGSTPIRVTSTETNALLRIESGGTFVGAGDMLVGYHATDSEGTVLVRDGGSLTVNSDLRLATYTAASSNLTGRLLVHTGGTARVTGYLGLTDTSTAREAYLEVIGSGAEVWANHAYLGGSSTAAAGEAFATVADQGLLVVTNSAGTGILRVWETAALTLDGGSIIANTLDMKADSVLSVSLQAAQAGETLIDLTSATALIANAVLEVSLAPGYNPGGNDVFTLINAGWNGLFKDGDGNPLADGAIVWGEESGVHVVLNYVDNNDSIILTAIPEPGTLALLALASSLLAAVRRKYRHVL